MLVWSSSFSNCADSFFTELPIATALASVSNFTVGFGFVLVLIMSLAKISARVSASEEVQEILEAHRAKLAQQ